MFENVNAPEETLAALKAQIARRLTPKPVKVRADIQVTCFDYAGIDAIKDALRAGEACSTEEVPIQVKLVAPPLYVMTTTSTDKQQAIERMEAAVEKIGEVIASRGGDLNIKMKVGLSDSQHSTNILQPKVVSDTDDAELKALMAQFEQANTDVAGDDDSSEDDE